MGIEMLVCFLHKFTAYRLQFILLIIASVGAFFNLIGWIIIKWKYIPGGGKLFHLFCLIIEIFMGLSIGLLTYFRNKKTIHAKYDNFSENLSLTNIALAIIGSLFSLVCYIVCSVEYEEYKDLKIDGKKAIRGANRFFTFFSLSISLICIIASFFVWISIYIRIIARTNGEYVNYMNRESQNTESNDNNSTISEGDVEVKYGKRNIDPKVI
jgi:hypothetical protein